MWFKIRIAIFVLFVLLAAGLTLLYCLSNFDNYNNNGSLEEAVKLRTIIESINSPETGAGCDPDYDFKKFNNGEWVAGIGRDSHALWSKNRVGGTVVLKDSRGQVRFFAGHVCGPRGQFNVAYGVASLDEFYIRMNGQFAEKPLP
jgi:hypothetical protein